MIEVQIQELSDYAKQSLKNIEEELVRLVYCTRISQFERNPLLRMIAENTRLHNATQFSIQLTKREKHSLLGYAKLLHCTETEQIAQWDTVQLANELPSQPFLRADCKIGEEPSNTATDIQTTLQATIDKRLTKLARKVIEHRREQQAQKRDA